MELLDIRMGYQFRLQPFLLVLLLLIPYSRSNTGAVAPSPAPQQQQQIPDIVGPTWYTPSSFQRDVTRRWGKQELALLAVLFSLLCFLGCVALCIWKCPRSQSNQQRRRGRRAAPPGLPRGEIELLPLSTHSHLPTTTHVDDDLQLCSICIEVFLPDQLIRTLPCSHAYHAPCVDAWLSRHGSCPHCRHELG